MQAITIPTFSPPSGYELTHVPKPAISESTDVLIRVHAASVNPVDVKKANGVFKFALKESFPYTIGYDLSGTVVSIGVNVTRFKPGDEVYVRLPESHRGSWAEFAVCPESFIAHKPPSISFAEAAALPLAGMTALQALRRYLRSLEGKTVFVPAGHPVSGTGMFACQLAKHHFKARRVITTVSTQKVSQVDKLLGKDTVDQIIDYKTTDPRDVISRGSVDMLFDTTGQAMTFLSLMAQGSKVVSIATLPSGSTLQGSSVMRVQRRPRLPLLARWGLDALDALCRARAWRWGAGYEYLFLEPNGQDLDTLRELVEDGKLKVVIGEEVRFDDIEEVKRACQVVFDGAGGLGKTVIRML